MIFCAVVVGGIFMTGLVGCSDDDVSRPAELQMPDFGQTAMATIKVGFYGTYTEMVLGGGYMWSWSSLASDELFGWFDEAGTTFSGGTFGYPLFHDEGASIVFDAQTGAISNLHYDAAYGGWGINVHNAVIATGIKLVSASVVDGVQEAVWRLDGQSTCAAISQLSHTVPIVGGTKNLQDWNCNDGSHAYIEIRITEVLEWPEKSRTKKQW